MLCCHRLRGAAECGMTTVDTSEKLYSQFIGFRGEIQSSRARLYPLSVNLGEVCGCKPSPYFRYVLLCFVLFRYALLCYIMLFHLFRHFNAQYKSLRFSIFLLRNRATYIVHRLLRTIHNLY